MIHRIPTQRAKVEPSYSQEFQFGHAVEDVARQRREVILLQFAAGPAPIEARAINVTEEHGMSTLFPWSTQKVRSAVRWKIILCTASIAYPHT